jgi:hypothetical protein
MTRALPWVFLAVVLAGGVVLAPLPGGAEHDPRGLPSSPVGALPASSSGPGNGSAPASYSVTFIASGLPPGAAWEVTLGSQTENETGLTALFIDVPHGSETFHVVAPAGYSVSPSHGTLSLAQNTSIPLDFSPSSGPGSPFGPIPPVEAYLILGLIGFGVVSVGVIEWRERRAARRRSP